MISLVFSSHLARIAHVRDVIILQHRLIEISSVTKKHRMPRARMYLAEADLILLSYRNVFRMCLATTVIFPTLEGLISTSHPEAVSYQNTLNKQ